MSTPIIEPKLTRCLVLGGNGFIGSHLVDALLKKNYLVRIFGRSPTVLKNNRPDQLEIINGDITDTALIAEVVSDCDICFHLINTTDPKESNINPTFDIESNLVSTINLLHQLIKVKIKKLIFLSSGGTVYGTPIQLPIDETHATNPLCSYGITKLSIEKYLYLYHLLYQLDYTILRLSNPFGEQQRINASQGSIAVFLGKTLREETINIWGDGSIIRDYIYISDVIRAIMSTINYNGTKRIFNIGSGQGLSLNQVLNNIEHVTGKKTTRNYISNRPFDVPVNILSIKNAKQELNWEPNIPFLAGLEKMSLCLKQELNLYNN